MSVIAYLRSLGFRFLHRHTLERELDDEVRSHVAHRADDLERAGFDRTAAERQARVEFGGQARFKEEARDALAGGLLETLARDLRFSVRQLRKSPSFSIAAIVTLAVAIGANAVVFGALNGFILRPLGLPHEETLVTVERASDHFTGESYPNYLDLRDRAHSFDALAAFIGDQAWLDAGGGTPTRAWVYEVSGNYFDVLGIRPYLGRFFHASDEHGPGSAPYIVLTYAYWRAHFLGDRGLIGRTVELSRHPFTIIGVAPPGFRGTVLVFAADFFVPLVQQPQVDGRTMLDVRGNRWLAVFGRRKETVTNARAVADLNAIGARLEATYPKDNDKMSFVLAWSTLGPDAFERPVHAFVIALMMLAALILLAACANLGSLFAARVADRSREVALRLALGAGRGRILRQLFTEAVLIALVGGAIGLWGSVLLLHWLATWRPFPQFAVNLPIEPDVRVYLVALLLSVGSGLLFGAVPVRQVLRTDPYEILKSGGASLLRRRLAMRDVLLALQIAICAVLVTSSLVAVRGLERSLHGNFGVDPQHVLLVDTDLTTSGYAPDRMPAIQQRMADAMRTIPGVATVGVIAQTPPMHLGWNSSKVFGDDVADLRPGNAAADAIRYSVSPDYFQAAGTSLLAGRAFTSHDDQRAPRVAIINQTFVRKVFASANGALGHFFKLPDGARIQVVGVAEDGKYTANLAEDPQPAMFFPLLQVPSSETWLVIRSAAHPEQLSAAVRATLGVLDPGLPASIETWTRDMDGALFAPRAAAVALGILGALGALVAITGIFGTAAYSLSKRLKELGIRMALGAGDLEVINAAVGRAFRVLAVGSLAGLVVGLLASRVLASIVYEATPRDPVVLVAAVVAMFLIGLISTWIPARRALLLDPSTLIRHE
ncbi:MAG: ADOP family duplicated permease [Gemmatimonadaceae bacterium]